MSAMHILRKMASVVIHGHRRAGSLLRIAKIRLVQRGVQIPWRTSVDQGVRILVSDAGVIEIGKGVHLGRHVLLVARGGNLRIDSNVFIGDGCIVVARTGIRLGKDSLIGERVSIRDQDHRIKGDPSTLIRLSGFDVLPIEIGANVWLGAGAVVLKGVQLGEGSVVGANSVVTGSVSAFEIVGGVPARHIGSRAGADA